jgi:hypothetical protein
MPVLGPPDRNRELAFQYAHSPLCRLTCCRGDDFVSGYFITYLLEIPIHISFYSAALRYEQVQKCVFVRNRLASH